MIGILSGIAITGWFAFLQREKLNKANDVIFTALQSAQREAKRHKLSYSASFINDTTGTPWYAIYPSSTVPASNLWKNLLAELNLTPNQMVIYSNIISDVSENSSAGATVSTSPVAQTSFPPTTLPIRTTVTFDYTGALEWQNNAVNTSTANNNNNNITTTQTTKLGCGSTVSYCKGLIVSVQANGLQRCVIIKTLLGTAQVAKDTNCN